uniref:DEX1 C-terminal domain-containing protein n=1 Tax=Chlamydomonas leiostraca TaxID=1034604 RepID=A0A7S0RKX6_9CHLO
MLVTATIICKPHVATMREGTGRNRRAVHGGWLCLMLVAGHLSNCLAQLSAPVSQDGHISIDGNKFLQHDADLDLDGFVEEEPALKDTCPQNVELKWMSEVSSSIYATPLITDLYSDGRKDIVVPSFVHYLEVLEGPDGAQAVGWPAFHKSTTHSSPLLYDIDFDGVRDILLATYDGEVLFFKDTGDQLIERLAVPRLKVRKEWFKGLNADVIDHSHPDVGAGDEIFRQQPPPGPKGPKAAGGSGSGSGSGSGDKADTQKQLDNYLAKMYEYKTKFGSAAMRQLLAETQAKSLPFYAKLMDFLRLKGFVDKDGKVVLPEPPTSPSPPPPPRQGLHAQSVEQQAQVQKAQVEAQRQRGADATKPPAGSQAQGQHAQTQGQAQGTMQQQAQKAATHGRRLMADGDGTDAVVSGAGAGGALGAEINPEGGLSDEAAASFQDLFWDDQAVAHDLHQGVGIDPAGGAGTGDASVTGGAGGAAAGAGAGAGIESDAAFDHLTYDTIGTVDTGLTPYEEELRALERLGGGAGGLNTDAFRFDYDELGDRFLSDTNLLGEDGTPLSAEQLAERDAFIREMTGSITDEHDIIQDHLLDKDHYNHLYLGDYGNFGLARDEHLNRFWQDEDFEQALHPKEAEYVYVDPHILSTPTLADIDADGHEELVVAVSYFYDREYYDQPDHMEDVKGLDLGKYVASGVVVFDLRTKTVKWSQHLDLSTDATTFKAYAYASPTLADIDRNGLLEIVVGTSMGFLYVLEPLRGDPLPGWPIQMGEIQGQALVMDLNNDGKVEIFAADTRGNIACFAANGEELWSRHVRSLVAQGATAGDINNDGELEIVFGTSSGHIYAVSGSTGLDAKNFPFRTHGRVQAPVLITRLLDGPAQHLIVMSFDGYLYLVDGMTACADTVDIGETSYSQVLAEDLDGNGRLELVVATMNGAVYALETPAEYSPLKAWPAQVMGGNGMVARHDLVGIYATQASRAPRDVAGDRLAVTVRVVDKRGVFAPNGTLLHASAGPYNISVVLKGVGVREMNAGHSPVIGVADTVKAPGTYTLELPCPRTRSTATIRVEMSDGHGLTLFDEFSLSFHLHFHKLLKWLVALPMAIMVAILFLVKKEEDEEEESLDAGGWHAHRGSSVPGLPLASPSHEA